VTGAAVIDASVGIKWVVDETGSEAARSLAACDLYAPDLFPIECANILWKKVRLRDLTRRDALERFDLLRAAPVAIVATRDFMSQALDLAIVLQEPVYDCVYLALAMQRGLRLITADARLKAAARAFRGTRDVAVLLSDLNAGSAAPP